MCRSCRNTEKDKPVGRVRVLGTRSTLRPSEVKCLSRERALNEEDDIFSVRRSRSTHTSLESSDLAGDCERLPQNSRRLKHSMSDEAGRLGLRLVEELSETTCSHRTRKRIRRGIVWQAAYSVLLTHPEGLAASPQSSNHSEDLILSSSPMTPYTH